MKRASRVKPISYVKTLALLKIIALGNRQIEEGRAIPLAELKCRIRAKRAGRGG